MTNDFDESKHPRTQGKFSGKDQTSPAVVLEPERYSWAPEHEEASAPGTSAERLADLAGHTERAVRASVAEHANTPVRSLRALSTDFDYGVRRTVADNPSAAAGDLAALASVDKNATIRDAAKTNPSFPENRVDIKDEDGKLAESRYGKVEGLFTLIHKFQRDAAGGAVLKSEEHFTDRAHHDPDPETPAVRVWDTEGRPSIELRYRHGEQQDAADGTPGLQAWSAGREQMHIHYSAGKIQDPAPGVPAHVATLENGMSRATFHTAGVATKQVDTLPMKSVLGDLVVTTSRER